MNKVGLGPLAVPSLPEASTELVSISESRGYSQTPIAGIAKAKPVSHREMESGLLRSRERRRKSGFQLAAPSLYLKKSGIHILFRTMKRSMLLAIRLLFTDASEIKGGFPHLSSMPRNFAANGVFWMNSVAISEG
jgi:hypothetical protein